jgi:CubicO group peptidase (beta-lactamase class C family)
VVKRISGKSVGTFLADEFAKPLALDLWVGLPAAEERRVSRLIELQRMTADSLPPEQLAALPDAVKAIIAAASDPDSLMNRMLTISTPPLAFNDPAVHAAEVPAANGITDARSLARFYASLVSEVDGVRLLEPPTIDNAIAEQSNGVDRCLLVPTRFGLGYMLDSGFAPLFGPRSFGHPGAGGSLGFADPDSEVAFGYVMNKMQQNLAGDPRTLTLIQAVRDSL